MLTITNIDTYGWRAAIRGMRNPMNSWDKMDSVIDTSRLEIGPNDIHLMKLLNASGDDHGKFARMITITMDILAPLYWWKEFDTYKVGTVANSCSTMHKISAKEFDISDFSHDHLNKDSEKVLLDVIDILNHYRDMYKAYGAKEYWWQMIQMLPSSYNQLRTVQLNYQVAKRIYEARKNHKLDEWRTFNKTLKGLPYARILIVGDDDE